MEQKKSLLDLTADHLAIVQELEESGGELTPEIEERLKINKEGLDTKVCAYQRIIASADGKAAAAKEQIERLSAYKKKQDATVARLEYYMLEALKTFGQQDSKGIYRLEAAADDNIVSLSTRKSESVEIINKDELPGEYWNIPEVVPTPDKKAIKEALKAGTAGPGAVIEEHFNLVIK